MKLELGSSTHPTDGYIHLDIAAACKPDVIADVTSLPFADGTVTDLMAVDILEHCSYRNIVRVAKEWARVLASMAAFYVQVPDARRALTEMWATPSPDTRQRRRIDTQHERARQFNLLDHPDMTINWILMGGQDDGTFIAEPGDWRYNSHNTLFSEELLVWTLDQAGLVVDEVQSNSHPNLLCWGHKP